MRFISSNTHGILDYLVGIALIAAPWLFGFANNDTDLSQNATVVPVVIGAAIIGLSLFTQYKYSIGKVIAYSTHLVLDMVAGILLAASPWLFNFANYVYLPHLVVGLAIIAISFCSVRMDSVNKTNRLVESTVR